MEEAFNPFKRNPGLQETSEVISWGKVGQVMPGKPGE